MGDLQRAKLAYLSSPYTRYPSGPEQAFIDVCKLTANLIRAGVKVFSPIAHSHPVAVHGGIDPLDQKFWYEFDQCTMAACDVLIVAHMEGWEQSSGIAHEVAFFEALGRPIWDLDPVRMTMARRPARDTPDKSTSEQGGASA